VSKIINEFNNLPTPVLQSNNVFKFKNSQFVVQDKEGGKCNTVSPIIKLKQTIHRFEKRPDGHVIVVNSESGSIMVELGTSSYNCSAS
jgi:hypothetical protein